MPKLFFVRDGTGDHQTSAGLSVTMEALESLLRNTQPKFTKSGPKINPEAGVSSLSLPYKHVVGEVAAGETNAGFPEPGFYYFIGLRPTEAEAQLNIAIK